jgi:hypothetical protein
MKNLTLAIVALSLLFCAAARSRAQELPQMPKPQKEHEWLERFVGEWDSEVEATVGPDQPAMRAKGSQTGRMLGGFWMIAEGKADMMGMNVQSVLTLGYDPKRQKYVGTWTDSCNNHLWSYEGTVNESGKTLTLATEGPNPMLEEGKSYQYRETIEFKSDDHYVFSSSMQDDEGEWVTFMTAHFRRKQ